MLHGASCAAQNERPHIPRTRYCFSIYGPGRLAIPNATPWDTVNIKKEIYRIFNHNGLRITIEANKQTINFLDVTFNLNKSTYQPFTKPNTTLHYVHRESNHPPITTKNIPAGINKRLSSLHPTKHPSTKPPLYIKKHFTKVDTCTLYITNHLQLINEETGNGTTYSGTLKENNTSFHRASDPCIKITLQQRKQEMQTLPQRIINYHLPTWIIINKRNELVSSCSHRGKALLRNNWTKFTATHIMQVRKVYKRWLRIFLTIKSPDEWVITKQACRDESIVSLFFPFLNICIYYFSSHIWGQF